MSDAQNARMLTRWNIVHTLNHNYVIDVIFQAHLQGREHGFTARNTQENPPLRALAQAQPSGRLELRIGCAH